MNNFWIFDYISINEFVFIPLNLGFNQFKDFRYMNIYANNKHKNLHLLKK